MSVLNSTLSGNGNSSTSGGGIANRDSATLTVISSTLSGNSASTNGGGGISNTSSVPSLLANTIVAANFGKDITGAINSSSSHNLIGVDTNLSGIINGSNGNLIGTAAMPINPLLGALQANGGPTATMALLPGSPAINAGDNSLIPVGVTTDQRGTGYARIDNGIVDIGAYELVVNHPPNITEIAGQDCTDTEVNVQVAASDQDDGDSMLFSISFVSKSGAGAVSDPTGFTIDTNGLFHWTPSGGQLGQYTFDVTVTDDGGLHDEQTFVVTTLGQVDGVLLIVGTDGNDKIDVKPTAGDPSDLTVRVNEMDYHIKLQPQNNPENPFTGVLQVHVCGLGGDDKITAQSRISLGDLARGWGR